MVARLVRLNWRTNLSASFNLRLMIPKPRTDFITRVHWWQYGTLAEAGNILASSMAALIEGPLPEGTDPQGMNANALRDDEGLRVLMQAAPGSSTATNSAPEKFKNPYYEFVHGVWTVQDVWVGMVTDGGVDNLYTSLSYEFEKIPHDDWLHYVRSSPNLSGTGELNQ